MASEPDSNKTVRKRKWPGTPFLWAIASGVLLWAAFPPLRLSPLVLVALVPLWHAAVRSNGTTQAALLGLMAGTTFGLLSVHWLRIAHPTGYLGWVALAVYLGCYWACSAALAHGYRGVHPWVWCGMTAATWVGLEYVRGWFLGGFPWFYLPHVFYHYPAVFQSVAAVSTYGLSLLLAACNAALTLVAWPVGLPRHVRLVPIVATLLLFLGNCAGGWLFLRQASARSSGPRLALVQTNVPQTVKVDPEEAERLEQRFLMLNRRIPPGEVDLVVWPETTWRHVWVELVEPLDDARLRRLLGVSSKELQAYLELVRARIVQLAEESGAATLLGLNVQEVDRRGLRTYNSAVLVRPDGRWERPYHKLVLLPFGEYVPLERWLPWLRWLSPNTRGAGSLTAGQRLGVYQVAGWRFGVLICFEDTLPWLSRRYVAEEDVDFLVNLTNDGWFGRTVQHEVHLATSLFRAVECGRPLARAVNTGISAVVDAYGRLVAVAGGDVAKGVWCELVLRTTIPVVRRQTPYVRWVGDWPGVCLMMVMLAATAWRIGHGLRTKRTK